MPENRAKTGKFEKGKSGNPGGRPKIPVEFTQLARTKSIDALNKLIGIMENKDSKPEHVIRAAETIISYGYGKPTQAVDLSSIDGTVGNPFSGLTTEQLLKLAGDDVDRSD